MKKVTTLFLFLVLLLAFKSFAQKVKVKKGKILVDGIEVGIIEDIDKSNIIYSVNDLSGKELFLVDVDIAEDSTRPFEFNWMTITSKDYAQVNVVDYSMISMSLSHRKIIAEILTKTYGIFSANGLNRNKVAEFFNEKRTSKYKETATGNARPAMEGLNEGFDGKIRIKDNNVLFDKKVIAKIEQDDYKYTFSSSSTKDKIIVENMSATLADTGEELNWLKVSDNKGRGTEVKMEFLAGNMKDSRAIAILLSEKYNVITVNGIENLDEFFSVKRKNLTAEYKILFEQAKESYLKEEAQIKYRIVEKGVELLGNLDRGVIYSKEGSKKYGTVESIVGIYPTNPNFFIRILDNRNGQIAIIEPLPDSKEFSLKAYNGRVYKVQIEGDAAFRATKYYRSIVIALSGKGLDNGIELGIEDGKIKDIEGYYRINKEVGNILNEQGYVLNSKGKKIQGLITLYFKHIPLPLGVKDLELNYPTARVNGRKTGNTFRFARSIGSAGSTRKARDGAGFCIFLDGGGEKCYRGKKLGSAKYGFVVVDSLVNKN